MSLFLSVVVGHLLRMLIDRLRVEALEFLLSYQELTVVNQAAPDSPIQPRFVLLVKLIEHHAQIWSREGPNCLSYGFLEIFVEDTRAFEASLGEAIVKHG